MASIYRADCMGRYSFRECGILPHSLKGGFLGNEVQVFCGMLG